MMHIFGWPFDTTQAVWRLIMGGVFERYPELKVITHHMGAMLAEQICIVFAINADHQPETAVASGFHPG